jgi:polysaccharide pyruvyl transferase CsaB
MAGTKDGRLFVRKDPVHHEEVDMSKRIVLLGYYGHDNLGDEAILEGIKQYFKELDEEFEIHVLSDFPNKVQKEHNVIAHTQIQPLFRGSNNPVRFLKQLLGTRNLIKESEMLIVGGGGLYQDYFRPTPYGMWEILLAKSLGKPIVLFSIGAGPYRSRMGRVLSRIVLKRADLITVRDDLSKKVLIEIGVKVPQPQVVRDPVISLDFRDNIEPFDLNKKEGPYFGISVRPWFNDKDYKSIIAGISDEVISRYNGNVMFIPLHFGRDERIMHEIRDMMRYKEHAKIMDLRYSVFQLMDIIGKMDVLIGMRLHSLILAAKMKVPFVGLAYDPKVGSFINEMDMGPYMCEISDVRVEDLMDKIDKVYKNKEGIKDLIEENMDRIEAEARSQLRIITDEIKRSG